MILAAINVGDLSKQRCQSYLKIKKVSEFNQMSYSGKRKKDKSLGKLIKLTIKISETNLFGNLV